MLVTVLLFNSDGAQLFLGISYLHNMNVIHRDIKPENIFFNFDGQIKIGDLGYAKELNGTTSTFCGTPSYMAPEVIKRRPYGKQVDYWGLGVVLFQLSSARSPFQEKSAALTFSRILAGKIRWPPNADCFTDSLHGLIEGLLRFSSNKRFGFNEVKSHEWFSLVNFEALDMGRVPPPMTVLNNVRQYAKNHDPMLKGTNLSIELSVSESTPKHDDIFKDF